MLQSTNKIIPQKTKTFPLKSQFCQVFCHLRIKSSKKKIHDHGNYRVIELAHPEFPSKTIHYIFCEKQTLISSFPKLQSIKQQSIIASRTQVHIVQFCKILPSKNFFFGVLHQYYMEIASPLSRLYNFLLEVGSQFRPLIMKTQDAILIIMIAFLCSIYIVNSIDQSFTVCYGGLVMTSKW